MGAGREAFGPAKCAETLGGGGKGGAIGFEPGGGDDGVVFEAIELERAEDVIA
jgi:hypothetical protein